MFLPDFASDPMASLMPYTLNTSHIEQAITEIQNGGMNLPGVNGLTNQGLQHFWTKQLKKPGTYPADVNIMLKDFMPAPGALLAQMEGDGIISRAESVAGSTNGSHEETGIVWLVNSIFGWLQS